MPGHSATGTNILVNNPVNNTEYICASAERGGGVESDPAHIVIAGEYGKFQIFYIVCIFTFMYVYLLFMLPEK